MSHAAVSLASHLGAKKTYIFGADFSYPFGKIYARNTFIYDYFNTSADRFCPLLKKCTDIVFRHNNTEMIKENGSFRYTTKTMLTYKKNLEKSANYLNMAIIQVEGDGEKITLNRKNIIHGDTVSFFSAGREKQDLKSFLDNYIEILKKFRFDQENLSDMYNGLKVKQQEVFKTILPIVSVLIRENRNNVLMDIYRNAADWTVKEVSRLLSYL